MTRTLITISLALGIAANGQDADAIKIAKGDTAIEVTAGGKPFATYHFAGDKAKAKPLIYPIHGPGGTKVLRDYPFSDDTPGEAHDHPHHQGLWYTHGDVNGVSFWHLGDDAGTIAHQSFLEMDSDGFTSLNEWNGPDGKTHCTDVRRVRFFSLPDGGRGIDFQITLRASHGDVKFGDTKEGTMGIRTNPALRLKGEVATGKALNGNGDKGGSLWGKATPWVYYWGNIGDDTVGVGIFDHPSNPRHPTTWHARDYGLVAANPFGYSYFQKKPKGAGDLAIKSGEEVSFRYGFVFVNGDPDAAKITELYKGWAK
jgi:hypothetical protein